MTANPQLRPVIAERRTPEENDASSPRRSRPRARLTNRSLTPPVAASTHVEARPAERASRSSLFPGRASAKVRTVILELARAVPPALASTSAASSARGAFHRRVLLVRGARHPFASFAAARWASGPRSPLSLARGEARPEVRTPVVHLRPRRGATCRPPTSAIETTREHDRTSCSNPAHPTRGRPRAELFLQVASARGRPLSQRVSGVANRGFMGQGPQMLAHRAASSERRSLAFEALPQPDRLGHLLSLARGDVGRWCRCRPALQ